MANQKYKFERLTPIDNMDLDVYEEAIDYVFSNSDVKNVAISGAYSAGKSSVLASYKKKHGELRFLHISLAHFKSTDQKSNAEVKESTLEGKILNQLIHQIPSEKIPQTNFRVKKTVSVAAVICIILVGSFTAKALGYDIWDAIIVWTKDTFGFETNMNEPEPTPYIKQIPAELAELENLMIEHGLSDDLIPGYIPDGYKILDLQYTDLADVDSIFCQLSNGSNDILFIYRIYSGDSTSFQLEKDALSPEKYESGGTTYYIMSNMDDYFVTWLSENIECTISGISTHDEALKMITSLNQS